MGNSKAKGSAFEREISKRLTLWLTGQKKELAFWRSSGSGATFTLNKGATREMSGDISGITSDAIKICNLINFELKNGYSEASFDVFLKNNKNDCLKSFWQQSCRDAKLTNKEPLVIFRKKRMPNIWCAMTVNLFQRFEQLKKFRFIMLAWEPELELPASIFLNLEDFLLSVTPQQLLTSFQTLLN